MGKFEDFNFDVTKTVKPQSSKTPKASVALTLIITRKRS